MKIILLFLVIFLLGSCNLSTKKEAAKVVQEKITEPQSYFPEALSTIFKVHGGLELWQQQRTLSYELPKPNGTETHTIALWSRKDRVDSERFSLGFDGDRVWLLDPDAMYKGDAGFYHNLMFYFYAMPFLLADDGIIYNETDDLVFEGKRYPGIHIAYKPGVGVSSKDEYFLHYDPETFQMAWLGYTVTYTTGKKSDTVTWIRYNNWQTLNGLVLPKAITWHQTEGRKILAPKNTVRFKKGMVSPTPKEDEFYAKPEEAVYVTVKKS